MSKVNQFNEEETRYILIDPLVKKAGRELADRRSVSFEIPLDFYYTSPINGITEHYYSTPYKRYLCKNAVWKIETLGNFVYEFWLEYAGENISGYKVGAILELT